MDLMLVNKKSDLDKIVSIWEQMAMHPSVDPEIRAAQFDDEPGVKPCITVVRSGDRIEGMVVGDVREIRLELKLKYFTLLRPHARVIRIFDKGLIGCEKEDVVEELLKVLPTLCNACSADFIHLACIPESHPIRKFLTERFHGQVLANPLEPRWVLTIPGSWEEFLKSRSSNTRYNIRRHERKLKEGCKSLETALHFPGDEESLEGMWSDVMEIFRSTYQYRLGLSPLKDLKARRTWDHLNRVGRLAVTLLRMDGRPVAFAWAQIYKDCALLGTPGYDPRVADLFVGEFAILRLIELLINIGKLNVLDYGLGYSQYKQTLGTSCQLEGHIRVYSTSPKGKRLYSLMKGINGLNALVNKSTERIGVKRLLKRFARGKIF